MEGIDVVVLGPNDLSGSMGLLGQREHPQVIQAIEQVIAEARRAQIPVWVSIDDIAEDVLPWAARGCQFVIVGEDHIFLRRTATQLLAHFRQ